MHSSYTIVELILVVSAINNSKMMAGGHTVHKRAAILLTMVVIPHTYCMENEKGVDTLRSMAIIT